MPAPEPFRLIGRGIYSLRDAERLTKVPRKRIRRWTEGYQYQSATERVYSPPVIAAATQEALGIPALDFADLIEVRFLDAFVQYGVSWPKIRMAAERARALLGSHPFSSQRFKTDGRTILAEIAGSEGDDGDELLDLVRNQYEFQRIVSPMLWTGLEFNQRDEPERWWPLGRDRAVVLDPERAFGAPIVARGGVPTRVLADAVRAEGSPEAAAELYEVSLAAVLDAVAFEADLAA